MTNTHDTMTDGRLPGPPLLVAEGFLTRETLDAAFARLWEMPIPQPDPVRVQFEIRLSQWLETQPPGTAEKLLRAMYGRPGEEEEGQ